MPYGCEIKISYACEGTRMRACRAPYASATPASQVCGQGHRGYPHRGECHILEN